MINARRLLLDEDAPPLLLKQILDREFNNHWLFWEPEVLWDEISDRLGIDLERQDRSIRDKIMALRTSIKTLVPWQDWHPFLLVVQAFNGISPDMELAEPVSPCHLAYTIKILSILHPDHEFNEDVKRVIAAILFHNGIYWVGPESLAFLDSELSAFQDSAEQQEFRELAQSDYDSGDTIEVEDDPVSMHTLRLKTIDTYLDEKEELAKRMM